MKGIFIGYIKDVKGFKVWCTDFKLPKCIISRDVIFHEIIMIKGVANLDKKNYEVTNRVKIAEFKMELIGKKDEEDDHGFGKTKRTQKINKYPNILKLNSYIIS